MPVQGSRTISTRAFIAPLRRRIDRRKLPHPKVVLAGYRVNFIEIKPLVWLLNCLEIKYQEIKKIASFFVGKTGTINLANKSHMKGAWFGIT
ncbi:MAG TPA: hypothetical protein DCE56_41025 [Cyanobacteria bacterium UBA8553]|nr:hypothetical protein [Cyanobacteria bacterium UBA8553]HAJ60697.1 hypothetical protein [Cyanobacteria bacterium UBA8543]